VDVSEADFDTVMATNVKGVFLSLKQVLPSMLDRGCGQIVVTNSVLVRTSSQ
jgi:NADP-dependent 3-hydroxy acid dehydrogenase YdfG